MTYLKLFEICASVWVIWLFMLTSLIALMLALNPNESRAFRIIMLISAIGLAAYATNIGIKIAVGDLLFKTTESIATPLVLMFVFAVLPTTVSMTVQTLKHLTNSIQRIFRRS